MELQIIEMFCLIDDILKELKIQDDVQCRMSTSEIIIITALVAARFFGGNQENARKFILDHN